MDKAAAQGRLDILQLLHTRFPTVKCSTAAMDGAAAGGLFQVMQWLVANLGATCTKNAIDGAAAAGHVKVVAWLLRNRDGGCTSKAIDAAASQGNIEMLRLLLDNTSVRPTLAAFKQSVTKGHLEVVKLLVSSFRSRQHLAPAVLGDSASINQYLTANAVGDHAMFDAINNNHFDVAKALNGFGIAYPEGVMDDAAAKGHLSILKGLNDVCWVGCTTKAMDRAAANGHLDVIQWLAANRAEGCTAAAFTDAAKNGHADVVQWFLDRQYRFTWEVIRDAKNGRIAKMFVDRLAPKQRTAMKEAAVEAKSFVAIARLFGDFSV
ncbi:ankyrin repeat-containing domain protein [Entophlyctis helioformis]|nr:ankyrin repeat-containing domain protein [Entophlyctis helioformis]